MIKPITFIINIQRPIREKIILGLIMGMGMLASAGSIAKTTKVHEYGVTGDTMMDMVGLTLWGELEMQLAYVWSFLLHSFTLSVFFVFFGKC